MLSKDNINNSALTNEPNVKRQGSSPVDTNHLVNATIVGTEHEYEILEHIGRGGAGDVYKAKMTSKDRRISGQKSVNTEHNQIVACKILLDNLLDDQQHYRRFQHEATLAKRLSHPNIVSVNDSGQINGRPFIILDYLEGPTLAQVRKAEGSLPINRALPIFLQISKALAYAHLRNVVHRDLKPSNIILVKSGTSTDFVKIVDFGIAKMINETVIGSTKLTKTGDVFGTPTYMSPEQCRGESLDGRSDIYSLGILMYEVLTGHPPFEGNDAVSILYKHTNEMPKGIADLNIDIRLIKKLESIIFKCLEKDPDSRYQSMDDLSEDLRSAIESGVSGSRLIASIHQFFIVLIRMINKNLSKPVRTRFWLLAVLVILIGTICLGVFIKYGFQMGEQWQLVSFEKSIPAAQRNTDWVEPASPAYAHDSNLFEQTESAFLEQGKYVKAFGDTKSETGFEHKFKFGMFYLNAGRYERANNEFAIAEQIASAIELGTDPETYRKVAKLERSIAKATLMQSNFQASIAHASKAIDICSKQPEGNYNVFASEVIPAWELVGRAALATGDKKLAEKAFESIYDLGTRNDYFKVMPEPNAYSFARAADFFMDANDFEKAETLLNYALLGWEHTNDYINRGIVLNKLGLIAFKRNDWKKAIELFNNAIEALKLADSTDSKINLSKILWNEADAYDADGLKDRATDCRREAKRLWYSSTPVSIKITK